MDTLKIIAKSNISMETMDGDLKEFIEEYGKPGLAIGDVNNFPQLYRWTLCLMHIDELQRVLENS